MDQQWFCAQCGECCQINATILVSELDIWRIFQTWPSVALEDGDVFIPDKRFLTILRYDNAYAIPYFRLQEKSKDACPFLTSNKSCSIYDKRPAVCRSYPVNLIYKEDDGWEISIEHCTQIKDRSEKKLQKLTIPVELAKEILESGTLYQIPNHTQIKRLVIGYNVQFVDVLPPRKDVYGIFEVEARFLRPLYGEKKISMRKMRRMVIDDVRKRMKNSSGKKGFVKRIFGEGSILQTDLESLFSEETSN